VVKDVSDEMLAWKTEGTRLYQGLPARLHATLRGCDPLRTLDPRQQAARTSQQAVYRTWNETRPA
jgi:phenylacetic acid degradation protein